MCSCCGKGGHVKERCQYKKVRCYKCYQIGHLLFVCTKGGKNAKEKGGGKQEEHIVYFCQDKED